MRTKWYFGGVLAASLGMLAWAGCGSSSSGPAPDTGRSNAIRTGGEGAGAAASSSAPKAGGTGWGNLTGTFLYVADPPKLPLLPTGGKDPMACNPDGIPNESLVVDSGTKGIKDVLIFARKVSRINDSYNATADEKVVFDQQHCMFQSHVMPMRVSQTLDIKNSDPVGHNTNIKPPADQPTNTLIPPGGDATYKFSKQQSSPVPVSCNIHPWMKAYILPRKNPYAVVTNEQGKFELTNLPAGEEIEFQLWHESSAGNRGVLVIDGLTNAKGRFKKTIEADGSIDLGEIKVPASAFSL